jgi:outer membrane receptor protein involved in Fe transport
MKTILTALIAAGLCFAHTLAQAQQQSGKLSGMVLKPDHQPVIAATVTLLKAKDSLNVTTTLTGVDGKFLLDKLSAGEYFISISAVSFDKYFTSLIQLKEPLTINIPVITLHPSSTVLKGVNITAQKPLTEQLIDRTVVNVGAFISNTGENALEALQKVPGLMVDDNGAITYKGKTGVTVLIDDRPTYLSGDNLANYLRSVPASQLDKIELMNNPPAQYDASGNAGIINIRTKKNNQKGFNGSFNAAVGKAVYWRSNGSLALNYRVNKLNFFMNAGYSPGKTYRHLDVERYYFEPSGALQSSYTENAYFHQLTTNPNMRTGVDYHLSPKTILGVIIAAGTSKQHSNNPTSSIISDKTGAIDSTVLANNNSRYSFNNGSINLNYTHQYDSLGKSLSFDGSYLRYNNTRNQHFQNTTYDNAGTVGALQNIIDNTPTAINIYVAKSDYAMPLPHKMNLSVGIKASFVNTDNAANYFNVNGTDTTVDLNNTNHFIYRENVQAGYVSLNQNLKRFSWQLGLRTEHTDVSGHQLGNLRSSDSSFVQHYIDVFPTVYALYKIDSAGHHQLIASYGRRVDRPNYQDMNPFVTILDKYSTFQGNPFLRPQYSGNYQLNYNYKSLLTFSLAYSRISGYKVENDYQQGDIFVGGVINLKHASNKSASLNVNLNPVPAWMTNVYVSLINNSFSGQLTTSYLNVSQTYFSGTWNNQFKLPRGWSVELNGFYNSPRMVGQFHQSRNWQIGAALQKRVMNNKGAIKLSARDFFRTITGGEITSLAAMKAYYHNDFDNRSVTLGFSYNFGTVIKNQRKHDATGADAEAQRVN